MDRARFLLLPTVDLRRDLFEDIALLRQEGVDDKMFFEIGALAKNRTDDTRLQHVGIHYTLSEALIEEVHAFLGDCPDAVAHLEGLALERMISAMHRLALGSYLHIEEVFFRVGLDNSEQNILIYPEEWLGEDMVLGLDYR